MIDGSFQRSVEDIVWRLHVGEAAMAEQPPSGHEQTLGPPVVKCNFTDHGCVWRKHWWLWVRNLKPDLPAEGATPPSMWTNPKRSVSESDADRITFARSATSPFIAAAVAWHWFRTKQQPAVKLHDNIDVGYADALRCARFNMSILRARFATTCVPGNFGSPQLIIIPMSTVRNELVVMVPTSTKDVLFGTTFDAAFSFDKQCSKLRIHLPGNCKVMGACVHPDSGGHICILPVTASPLVVGYTYADIMAARSGGRGAMWVVPSALAGRNGYGPALLAAQRVAQMTYPSAYSSIQIGCNLNAIPRHRSRAALQWGRNFASKNAELQWTAF